MKRFLTILTLGAAICAPAAFALNITPFLTCVTVDHIANQATAYLGYESFEQSIIQITVGSNNRIIPDPPDRNQPTLFLPGYFEKAFRVTFPASSAIFWSFNGFAIPASSVSPPCPSTTPTLSLPPGVLSVPYSQQLSAAGGLGGLTWSALSPLPGGLTFSPSGLLSGTPQTTGLTYLTFQATDGTTTSMQTYGLFIGSGVTINDAASTRAPGFTPQFRVVTNIAATITSTASCATTEFVITGGGGCTVPNSNTVQGRVASSGPATNGWTVTCSGGTATAVAICSKQ
jgi:hypothetical protein